jgi:hypothetical protein
VIAGLPFVVGVDERRRHHEGESAMGEMSSPLRSAEREFLRLAPEALRMQGREADGWLADREFSLLELRDVLMHRSTPHAVRDGVWRRVIASARVSQEWMVGAIGLGMPGLRSVASRTTRGLGTSGVEEVEAEVLIGFMEAVRSINPAYARLAFYLRCRAQRAGLKARRREAERPEPCAEVPEARMPHRPWGHPDMVLADAVHRGVLSASEAELIGGSRLGGAELHRIATDLGVAYKTAAKRRERAESRLARAVREGRVTAAGSADAQDSPTGAEVVGLRPSEEPVSHPGLGRAS